MLFMSVFRTGHISDGITPTNNHIQLTTRTKISFENEGTATESFSPLAWNSYEEMKEQLLKVSAP